MDKKTACLSFAVSQVADPSGTGPTRFRGVAYSGGVIPQYGYYGDACIDLASLTLPAGDLFALVDHDPAQRAGKFASRIDGNAIIVEGELFASSNAGREVAALMAEGAPWQMSVGIQAESDSADKKRAVQCNGQTLDVNTIFRNAVLREVSFVPVGADPQTSVQAFSRNLAGAASPLVPHSGDTDMTIEELQAQVADLSAKLEAETTARQSAESDLAAVKLAARKDAVKQLAADLGRDLKDDETAALEKLDAPTFATMSATLLSFKPAIISAIDTGCPLFKLVGGAAEFDAAIDGVKTTPSCFVIPLSESADANVMVAGNLQRVNVTFGVCIAVKHARNQAGMLADLETLRASVRSALLGKVLGTEANSQPISYSGGQLIDFQPGLMWWQDGFKTAHHISN